MSKKVIVVLCVVMGFSTMMAVQSIVERHSGATTLTARPQWMTCKTEPNESGKMVFGHSIYVTNTTGQTLKRHSTVKYTIGGATSEFLLTSELAPNATQKQLTSGYTGTPDCKAWAFIN